MASDALNQVRAGFNNIGESSRTFQRNLSDVNGTMSSTMSTAMRFAGIIAGGLLFNSAIQSAYSYTKTMEDTKLGLASLAYATMDFKDAQGQLMTGQTAFNESLRFSAQLQDKLRIAGLTTAATYEQLAQSINVAWVPAMKAGFNPDQIIQFTQAITQQATAMGMDLSRMSEEIRSVLTGNMRDGDTQLKSFMEAAGLTNAKIKELLGTGQLFPAMMHAFEGSTMAAAVANTNLSTIMSNLKDGIQGILGTTFSQFFDAVKISAADLTSHLVTVNDGTIQWNQSLVEIGSTIGSSMGAVVTWTYEHIVAVAKWIAENEDMIQIAGLVAIAIGSLWASLLLLQGIAGITNAIIMFETTLEALAGAIGLCEAMLAPWVIAIAAVAAAFALWQLYPLIKDVELFGHTIDTWIDLLKFKTQEILASAVEMFTNAFWNTPQEYIGKFLVLIADGIESFVSFWTSGNVISSILEWYKHIYYDIPLEYGSQFLSWLAGWFDSFKTFWSQGFSGIVSSAVAWFTDLFVKKIPELLAGFGTKLGEWFGKIAEFFKNFSLATAIDDIRNWGKSWQDSANQGKAAAEEHKNQTLAGIQVSKDAALQAEAKAKAEKTAAEQEKQARVEAEAKKTLAVQDNAKEIDKIRKDQDKLHERLWKGQTALIEDETDKQLVKIEKEYIDMKELAHGNAKDLKAIDEWYAREKAQIIQKAAEKSKKEEAKRLQDIADKHREYRQVIEKNEAQSLDNRLAANRKWYTDELRELDAWAEKHKVTGRELDGFKAELDEARRLKEAEIRQEVAKKEEEALKEKVKVWDKAYESMQDTLSDFLETGKFDLKNFGKMFKSWVADLVSSWMVNTARMNMPAFLGGTAGLAAKTAQAAGQGGAPGASGATGSGSSVSAADANSFLSGMTNMTKSFGEFLSGGWAKDLGKALSDNGATSVGGWLQESGTSGILSGASGAAISAGIGSAIITGLATGNAQKSIAAGVGAAIGAGVGKYFAGDAGAAIGATLGNIAGSYLGGGDKYDDANLFMSIGDSSKAISEYTDYVGEFSKALYEPVRNGDLLEWVPNPNEAWSVQTDSAFMLDIRKGDSGMSGTAVKKLESDIADYFKTIFKSIDNTFNINVRNIIRSSRIGLGINVTKLEEYLNSGDIEGVMANMTGQFFDVFGNAISSAIFEIDTGILFNTEALESMKRDSETLGETFIRVASLLQAVPEGIARLRQYMEQGLTEAEAFDKIETQYAFVSGTIANALSEAMQQGVKAADFEAFQETFATSLENQLKAAVAASFQQQILGDVITASFGSMAGFSDMLKDMHDGKITISEFKSYMQSGMAAAKAAIAESEPLLKDLYNIIDLAPKEDDTAIVQARELASSVVSGTITSALKSGVDAADWNVFKANISTQMNEQMKNVVLNTFASNMISSIMASVYSDGGIDLNKLTTDFTEGRISSEQFSSTLGNATTRMEAAAQAFQPLYESILKGLKIQPATPELTDAEKATQAAVDFASDIVSESLASALNAGVEAADWNVFKNSIESQLSSQLQNIVLQTFTSNMISSVMSSVFADGGGLSGLVTDFMAGNVSADEFSATIGSLSGKMAQAADAFGPMFHNIMKALDIQPKEDKSSSALAESTSTTASATTEAALEMVDQTEAVTDAVEKFKTNSADANLMLAFLSSLVEKIPDLAESYTVLDAAIMRHREGLLEYGSGIGELTTSLAGYIAEVKDVVAALESTTRAAIARAADAAESAASSASLVGEIKDISIQLLKHSKKTADILTEASDGESLNVKTKKGSIVNLDNW